MIIVAPTPQAARALAQRLLGHEPSRIEDLGQVTQHWAVKMMAELRRDFPPKRQPAISLKGQRSNSA